MQFIGKKEIKYEVGGSLRSKAKNLESQLLAAMTGEGIAISDPVVVTIGKTSKEIFYRHFLEVDDAYIFVKVNAYDIPVVRYLLEGLKEKNMDMYLPDWEDYFSEESFYLCIFKPTENTQPSMDIAGASVSKQ